MIFVVFGCLQILFSLYFWLMDKHWENLAYMGGLLTILSVVLCVWKLPETPRFHFSKKRFDEARKTLIEIAKFNGHKNVKHFLFECEAN